MNTAISVLKVSRHGRRTRKSIRNSKYSAKPFNCRSVKELYEVKGLKRIEISPLAQKFVGCRIGENITTDVPWVFVDKEKIEDHIEFYEENSDFFPIIADIRKMPNSRILFGTYHHSQEENVEFYVCVTPEAEALISESVERERKALRDKILNSFYPTCGKWNSLGSEPQVDCELNKNLRPLVVIDLEGYMPLQKETTYFSVQDVENLRDGYIELITTRSAINSIMRKRMDRGTQSSPLKLNKEAQVVIRCLSNKNIQYSVEYSPVSLTGTLLEKLKKFLQTKLNEFSDVLKLNFSLGLYHDDYTHLGKSKPVRNMVQPTEIKSYQDVINCRRRKISCFTWNAIISGIVAAAHAFLPNFCIEKSKPSTNIELETVFESHLVLLWHYSDNVQPKLYLHATRDVTALSFCPYDANILVAGYNNGQVAVWDLRKKLDSDEAREFLTDIEQKNHILIQEETKWFRRPLPDNHVFPVLCSSLEEGHRETVTTIQWVPPSKFVAPQRMYKDSSENEPHMQFITASLDGSKILIWDLFITKNLDNSLFKKKHVRLSTKPEALLTNISPLNVLKKMFRPVCRLIMKRFYFPITGILVQDKMYCYVAENSHTLNDIDQKTYFKVSEKNIPFDYSPKLIYTTGIGTFHEATWEGSEFDPKFYAVDESCQIDKFADIHDGPILVCEANPLLPDVILTIGGSIFAIWCITKIKAPVFWRKAPVRYMTGMWSLIHPLSVIVVRSDTYYELWNIYERSNLPIQIYKYKGYKLTKLYKDSSRSHVRKSTCVITDTVGAFKLYSVPSENLAANFNIQEAVTFLEQLIVVKENVTKVKENVRKMGNLVETDEEENAVVEKVKAKQLPEEGPVKSVEPLTRKQKWELKLERHMRKVLYEKKKINLSEIETKKEVLQKILSESEAKDRKLAVKKSHRESIFKKAKDQLMVAEEQKPRRSLFKCDVKVVKETYLNDYKKIEEETMGTIRNNEFVFDFNWPTVLMTHKKRYKLKRRNLRN